MISKLDQYKLSNVKNGEKKKNTNKQNLRDLWDNNKQGSIHVIEIPKEEERKGEKKILEEITAQNFPNVTKNINLQIKEAQG